MHTTAQMFDDGFARVKIDGTDRSTVILTVMQPDKSNSATIILPPMIWQQVVNALADHGITAIEQE